MSWKSIFNEGRNNSLIPLKKRKIWKRSFQNSAGRADYPQIFKNEIFADFQRERLSHLKSALTGDISVKMSQILASFFDPQKMS